jgi:hypothetical protein
VRFAGLLALGWLLFSKPVAASFHLMMVVEIFPGVAGSTNAQYVELQMYAPGQNLTNGTQLRFYNAAGALTATHVFTADVMNGADQASILIATTQAQTLFGMTADQTMGAAIDPAGGKVCFLYPGGTLVIDCAAWGSYVAGDSDVGPPFSPGGLPLGQAMQRRISGGSNPVGLDFGDDSNLSVVDFVSAAPAPRNNGNVTGTFVGYASTPAPPGPVAFGSVVVGFPLSASFTIQETGTAPLTASNPAFGGAHPGDFAAVTAFPIDIADGAAPVAVQLRCTPQAEGERTATLTLTTNDPLRPAVVYDLTCTGEPIPPAQSFFTVDPCREVDTRLVGGPVAAGNDRTLTIGGGTCGIPVTATAVSLNIAVTQPTVAGNVRLYPAGGTVPTTSTINYSAGQTRTNNAIIGLNAQGELTVRVQNQGSVHVILDVNGYFLELAGSSE